MAPLTWLITGASSGLGKSLAAEVLKAGHKVIGTTRDVAAAQAGYPEFLAQGGVWMKLDPAHSNAFEQFRNCAQEHGVDVLVNNAAYALIGSVEDTSEQELRQQMEVNFYGPLRAVRACLPTMRSRGSGHIVLVSSASGFIARPGGGSYSASKFAVEAIHESLAAEVKAFGIRVLIVEPGAFRTPFASRALTPLQYESTGGCSEVYRGTVVEQMVHGTKNMMATAGLVKGDPDKAANAIFNAVSEGESSYLRLPLGKDSVVALENKIGQLQNDLDVTRDMASSTEVDEE